MQSTLASRIPSVGRIFSVALLLVGTRTAHAQVWTEEDVAQMAAERAVEVRAALARAELARARAGSEGLYPNPSIDWERQEAFAPNAQAQDLVRATVPLDFSGRRGARRALAEVEASLAEADAAVIRAEAVEGALLAFYGGLAAERRLRSYQETQEAIDEASRVVRSREATGEASGYASARLAIEAELARSRLEEARLQASTRRALLAALLGAPAPPERLSGTLDVEAAPALAALLSDAASRRPERAALRDAESAAGRARSAADFAWVPRLDLSGGYNRQQGQSENIVGHGYTVRLAVEIPLFDHGQRERAESAAASSGVTARREALEARVTAEVRAQHARLVGLLAERRRFETSVAEPLEVLSRAAASGYREGERTVIELVDAQRAVADARERAVALDLAARNAEIALRRASGALR